MLITSIYKYPVRRVYTRLFGLLCFCFAGVLHRMKNPGTCVFCMEQTMLMSDLFLSLTCERRLALLGKNNFEI